MTPTPSKRLIVVTGFESSGSVFLAKIVSHVTGKCRDFGDWKGYGWNGAPGDAVVVAHRSLPYNRPRMWLPDLRAELAPYCEYQTSYVICTRDLSISQLSRQRRFGGTPTQFAHDNATAKAAFADLLDKEDCFIFSYETAVALQEVYYQRFYRWLGVASGFAPPVFDGNAPYIGPPRS